MSLTNIPDILIKCWLPYGGAWIAPAWMTKRNAWLIASQGIHIQVSDEDYKLVLVG